MECISYFLIIIRTPVWRSNKHRNFSRSKENPVSNSLDPPPGECLSKKRRSLGSGKPLTSRQGTRGANELIVDQDLRAEMERGISKGRRRKETSLSRIFDQPLGRANSLARNNWISSKREEGKRSLEKAGRNDARRRFILCRIMLEQTPTIIRN